MVTPWPSLLHLLTRIKGLHAPDCLRNPVLQRLPNSIRDTFADLCGVNSLNKVDDKPSVTSPCELQLSSTACTHNICGSLCSVVLQNRGSQTWVHIGIPRGAFKSPNAQDASLDNELEYLTDVLGVSIFKDLCRIPMYD